MPNLMVALPNIGGALNASKFGSRPLLDCRAVTLPYDSAKLGGRKVNFAPGKKFRYGATAAENVYIVYQPR